MSETGSRKDTQSPILKQILDGGSSVSFNISKLGRALPQPEKIFSTIALNNVIVFKYPNFSDNFSLDFDGAPASDADMSEASRPIETGIYIPHLIQTPSHGGYAIYMRGKNYENLLQDHFGINLDDLTDGAKDDIRKLKLIDGIPSLDPFLLKTSFEAEKTFVADCYWNISQQEDDQLRSLIRQRIEPIVLKALQKMGSDGTQRVERFLESIWNPKLPEAKLFLSAFGIEQKEAEYIFAAWKGVTFYEFQLRRIAKQVTGIVAWMKSKDCIPSDIRMYKTWEAQLLMYIEKVGKELDRILCEIRTILIEYDRCFKTFMDGDPKPFTKFLRTAQKRYWVMGYCISSLSSVTHTYDRYMQNRPIKKLSFDNTQLLMKQLEVAMDRRREMSSTL